ncbi:30S ribosomal protein S17 [Candidatus Daviesbacteria bacterium]|nr:30S ribosomal protein S17 [Candidatus Daviesbacteria bacterium]
MIGRVVSTKLKNTVTVLVERVAKHPLYKKTFVRSKRYLVDDLVGVKEGDIVEIIKIRPISKNKHWRVAKVVGKNLEEITEVILKDQAEKVISEVMPEEKELSSTNEELSDKTEIVKKKVKKVKKEDKNKKA